MIIAALFLASSLSGNACSSTPNVGNEIQWSRPAILRAPNRLWQIEVTPNFTGSDNASPASLRWCATGRQTKLLVLRRFAEIRWGNGGAELLLLDEPLSGSRKIFLYHVSRTTVRELPIDKKVRTEFGRSIGGSRRIVFYIPRVGSWNHNNLVLAVGGTSIAGDVGPTKSHCLGITVDSGSGRILETMSAQELARRYHARCQISP